MTTSGRSWDFCLAGASFLAIGYAIATSGDCVLAQITPDTTLGAESSIVTPTNIDGLPTEQIDGGATRGANLFHSFEQFSVPAGGAAYFNNALNIQNIISRVTGSSISNIDGLLRANGAANLFLLNPNGFIFGSNATLSIGGSFVGSTASSLNFADGTQFSANAPTTTPLLTVSVPLGLQFGGNPGSIVNQSQAQSLSGETNSQDGPVGLQVPTGQTLALVGGNVVLEGGNLTTAGGRIELGSVAGNSLISLNPTDNGWTFDYEGTQNFQDIQLSQQAVVDTSGSGGGDIQVQGRGVTLIDESGILAYTLGSKNGGGISIQSSQLNMESASRVDTTTFSSGKSGDVTIETGKLVARDGGQVVTGTLGSGQGGNLTVNASESVEVIGESADGQLPSSLFAATESSGDAGNLTITTGNLIVRGAQVVTGTLGSGQGGNLTVNASESVEVIGTSADGQFPGGLFANTRGAGDAGDLTITTGNLIVGDGAEVSASVSKRGEGQGGNLTVNASESVEVIGTSADGQFPSDLSADTNGAGDAGNLMITTGNLIVRDGGQVGTGTFGSGSGGTLEVMASESVELSGTSSVELSGNSVFNRFPTGLFTSVEQGATGDGGNLTVETGRLIVRDGAQVSSATLGAGAGGNLAVRASDSVELSGTSANGKYVSNLGAETIGSGNAGDLTIETGQLTLRDEAEVNVSSYGTGNAGNLEIAARSIRLDNKALLSSDTIAGQGNIILNSQDLVLRRDSNITTNATGTVTGGNITIDTGVIAALENSDISANAQEARGGRVIIDAQGIFGTEFQQEPTSASDITATSELGPEFSGTVEINTPDVDPSRGLVTLPAEPVDASGLIAQACPAGGGQVASEFIVTGRGGLPENPSSTLSSDAVQVDLVTLNPKVENRSSPRQSLQRGRPPHGAGSTVSTNSTSPHSAQIVEANGWVIGANGQVVLIATATSVTPHSPGLTPSECGARKSYSGH